MAAGFGCLGATYGPWLYFIGCILAGIGFQMMALIPGTHVLAAVFPHRGLPFGVYFTAGAAGGVAGPVMALGLMRLFDDQWRLFWLSQAAAAIVVGAICIGLVGAPAWLEARAEATDRDVADEAAHAEGSRVYRTTRDWSVREAVRTPQFYVLLAAYFGHLLVGIAVSSWSIAHLTQRGAAMSVASVMLSLESLAGALARAAGGVLGDRVDPRYLLLFALLALTGGSVALSLARGYPLMLTYAGASGAGFGLTALAVPLLLLNYYGRRNNLEIFSLTCLIGAVSALGSLVAGMIRDATGGFAGALQLYAVVIAVVFVAAAFMRPPRFAGSAEAPPERPRLAGDAA
jgi:MFS family permease